MNLAAQEHGPRWKLSDLVIKFVLVGSLCVYALLYSTHQNLQFSTANSRGGTAGGMPDENASRPPGTQAAPASTSRAEAESEVATGLGRQKESFKQLLQEREAEMKAQMDEVLQKQAEKYEKLLREKEALSDTEEAGAFRKLLREREAEIIAQKNEEKDEMLRKQAQRYGKLLREKNERVQDEGKTSVVKGRKAGNLSKLSREWKEKAQRAKAGPKPMNIVLFYADDWRHDTLGAAGNPIVKTPVLDALAKEGVRFTENCVTTSICWVSRATLLSGQYLARHHFEMLGKGRTLTVNGEKKEMGFEVPDDETLYGLLKRKAGYSVGHAGKLGLWVPFSRKNYDFLADEDGWHWRQIGNKLWHITEKNTADALRYLESRDRTKPFFLNVAYFATHAVDGDKNQYMPQNASMSMYTNDWIPIPPTATAEAWKRMPPFFGENNEGRTRWRWRFDEPKKHQRMMKNYYRMASEVDTSVGAILKRLEDEGELNNTLIIFTTDNGNFHAEHGLADKWYPHQESIRVPLIIKDPRMDPEFRGTTNGEFTLNIDLTTTILAAAGLDPLPSMMGRDMSVLYRDGGLDATATLVEANLTNGVRRHPSPASDGGGTYHSGSADSWRTEFFYEHPMHSNPQFIPASEALVRKDYKYFYWPNFKYEQLFDMTNDPGEMNNLFKSTDPVHQQKLKEMRKRFGELKQLAYSDKSIIL